MSANPWDERYAQPGLTYGAEPNDFLVSVVDAIPRGPVLCIGEGEGRNALYLASLGYEVEAVDASAVGLAKARTLAGERGLELRTTVTDLAHFDFGQGRWSGIVAIFCHLPPPVRQRVHRCVVEGLCAGGVFVAEAYAPAQLGRGTGGPQLPELLYDPETLRRDLAGLELIQLEERVREIHEGRLHTGKGAVVQVVGIKQDQV
jgi:SAM-dependent methyltransferase